MLHSKLVQSLQSSCIESPRQELFWQDYNELNNLSIEDVEILFPASPRRLGRQIVTAESDIDLYCLEHFHFSAQNLSFGQIGRILIVLNLQSINAIRNILYRGNDSEKQAILLALPYVKNADAFKDLAVDSCRTHSSIVYLAISNASPYPRDFFSDAEFRQMAIKTIFMELSFSSIVGLHERYHPEFGQSLIDLYEERESAQRELPKDVINFMKEKNLL